MLPDAACEGTLGRAFVMITGREGDDAAIWFYREIVQPTVAEFLTERESVRRVVLACIVLSHMADHTFMRHPVSSLGDSRTELRANGAFWLIEMSRMGPSTSNEDVMVGSVSRISGRKRSASAFCTLDGPSVAQRRWLRTMGTSG